MGRQGGQGEEEENSEVKEAPATVIDQAFSIVEKSLDAITIVKQINVLKFISHFILKEYHTKLVPLVALNIDLQKNVEYLKTFRYRVEADSGRPIDSHKSFGRTREMSDRFISDRRLERYSGYREERNLNEQQRQHEAEAE